MICGNIRVKHTDVVSSKEYLLRQCVYPFLLLDKLS